MKVYILCPVREASNEQKIEIEDYIYSLKEAGHEVHSFQDVNQNDPTGYTIVKGHLEGMRECDEVHVFWDVSSSGSHCDFGMALGLDKKLVLVKCFKDNKGKSYWKAMKEYVEKGQS